VPYALYRAIAVFQEARDIAEPGERSDLGWAAAYALLVLGSLAMLFATIKFGAVVRTADLRYWWVYPAALIVACGLYILPTLRPHRAERITPGMIWPGMLALIFTLLLGFFFLLGQNSGDQVVQAQPGRSDTNWPIWLIGGLLLVVLAYVLIYTLPRRPAPTRMFLRMQGLGMLAITGFLLITIFFSQSRGPWLGIAAGLFVFFTLLLWNAYRRAHQAGASSAARWRGLLIGEIVLALTLGGFIVAFNTVDSPFFNGLRSIPYIGRLGTLLESESGTGLVRRLIWVGDDKAGGAVGLITSDPLRAVIGWGPESMFVAYNKFYPPALANIEARGASPDRSHEAYLDELVTKGLLGLISYLFVLISFFALAWRLARHGSGQNTRVLAIAGVAIVVAHVIEGLTGIPIVSTLMMLWLGRWMDSIHSMARRRQALSLRPSRCLRQRRAGRPPIRAGVVGRAPSRAGPRRAVRFAAARAARTALPR
jgi:hypothetical protein